MELEILYESDQWIEYILYHSMIDMNIVLLIQIYK